MNLFRADLSVIKKSGQPMKVTHSKNGSLHLMFWIRPSKPRSLPLRLSIGPQIVA